MKISFSQFIVIVIEIEKAKSIHLRKGQLAYNILYNFNQELAKEILATEKDPFYSDERLPDFFKFLIEKIDWSL